MKKILLSTLAICFALLLVAPLLLGVSVRSISADTLLALASADLRQDLMVEQDAYRRGWFSSRSRVRLSSPELNRAIGQPLTLLLDIDIRHGPLLLTAEGPRLGSAYASITPNLSGSQDPHLQLSSLFSTGSTPLTLLVGFDDSLELAVDLSRIELASAESQLNASSMRGITQLNADYSSRAELALDSARLALPDSEIDLSIQNLTASGWNADLSDPFSRSESTLAVARLTSEGALPLVIQELQADYRFAGSAERPDTLELSQHFSAGRIDWQFPISALDWQLQLSELERDVLNSVLQQIGQSSLRGNLDQEQSLALAGELGRGLLLQLARTDFRLDNTLRVTAYDGRHDLQLRVNWLGLPDVAAVEAIEPGLALDALEVFLSIDADQAALMNSPFAQTVTDYQALLVVEGGRVKASVNMANGQLTINDETFPLQRFVNF